MFFISKPIFIFFKIIILLSFPHFAFAIPQNFRDLVYVFINLINSTIPIIISLALLVFLVGVFGYIYSGGDTGKSQGGKDIMLWGIIGLFVMVSVWGLVGLLTAMFFNGG